MFANKSKPNGKWLHGFGSKRDEQQLTCHDDDDDDDDDNLRVKRLVHKNIGHKMQTCKIRLRPSSVTSLLQTITHKLQTD